MAGCLLPMLMFFVSLGFMFTGIYVATADQLVSALFTFGFMGFMMFTALLKAAIDDHIDYRHEQQMKAIENLEKMLREQRSEEG